MSLMSVACTGVTMNAVARSLGIELRDASLQAEGDLYFRRTLGYQTLAHTAALAVVRKVATAA
jgi:hypothetical protein